MPLSKIQRRPYSCLNISTLVCDRYVVAYMIHVSVAQCRPYTRIMSARFTSHMTSHEPNYHTDSTFDTQAVTAAAAVVTEVAQ